MKILIELLCLMKFEFYVLEVCTLAVIWHFLIYNFWEPLKDLLTLINIKILLDLISVILYCFYSLHLPILNNLVYLLFVMVFSQLHLFNYAIELFLHLLNGDILQIYFMFYRLILTNELFVLIHEIFLLYFKFFIALLGSRYVIWPLILKILHFINNLLASFMKFITALFSLL